MKLNIERGALLKSLGHIQSVVERRNTIPILSNVLLEGEEGRLNLAATDLDIAIGEGVAVETEEPGGITAPAHTLYDICLLYTSPSPRDRTRSRMPSSA